MIVGRNADVLLADKKPFRIFVCAGIEAKIQRCMGRALEGEEISRKGAEQNIRRIDRTRAKTREILGGGKWGEANAYPLTVNTEGWNMEELASAVDGFFVSNFVGKTPFAAVNFIMPVLMILGSVGFMFGSGGSALVSKTMGEGEPEKAR